METDLDKMLQELVHGYRTKCTEDAKLLEEAVEAGEAVFLYPSLFKNANQPALSTNEKLLHSIRLFYFMGYCMIYNNGIPMLEVLSDWIDNDEKRKVINAVKSQSNLFDVLIEQGVDIKILADYIDEREMIEYATDEEKKSTGVLKRILNRKQSILKDSTSPNSLLPSPIKTKIEILSDNLSQYGFFELEKVIRLSKQSKESLIEKISENGLPYAIAMFDFLQFIPFLEKQYFDTKYKLYIEVSKWFGTDKEGRAVKGNISSLLNYSTEKKNRYTAYQHKENVKNDYEQLK